MANGYYDGAFPAYWWEIIQGENLIDYDGAFPVSGVHAPDIFGSNSIGCMFKVAIRRRRYQMLGVQDSGKLSEI